MELKLDISLNCNIGCIRSNNEDMILISGETYRDASDRFPVIVNAGGRFVAAVADGMGGHNAGQVASQIALDLFDDFVIRLPEGLSDNDFRYMVDFEIRRIHRHLIEYGQNNAGCAGLGTTLVAWLTYDNRIYILNSGDSRIYRLRNGILCQITTDHSEQNRKDDPTLPSNLIYNCLGGGGISAFADVINITNKVFDEDIFMLCSDGLSDMLDEDKIEEILSSKADADALIDEARNVGGNDNISAIILKIDKISRDGQTCC